MAESILIARRFRGPPESGNGGYVCGRLAAFLDEGPAQARLLQPPPLDVEMEVRRTPDGVELVHGVEVVARARRAEVSLQVPEAPAYDEAVAASSSYRGFHTHPFPGCFVCGPERGAGDGLRVFPGPVGGIVAAPWVPDDTLAGANGRVRSEFLWAALDCPGAYSFDHPPDSAVVLGELAVAIEGPVAAGERCVLVGWELGREGRKHHTGTALYAATGERRGVGRATWFEVPRQPGGRG